MLKCFVKQNIQPIPTNREDLISELKYSFYIVAGFLNKKGSNSTLHNNPTKIRLFQLAINNEQTKTRPKSD